MNTLYLLRHSNAGPGGIDLRDKDRPLSDQGLQTCQTIATQMQDDNIKPDLVICSSALRTRQTLEAIRFIWETLPETIFEDSIYEAFTADIIATIAQHTSTHKNIMVIGHNPGLQDLALQLSNSPASNAYKEAIMDFSPGCMAKLSADDYAWSDITPRKFTFLKFYRP